MSEHDGRRAALELWLASRLDGATEVAVGGLDTMDIGHSAEMLTLDLHWRTATGSHARDTVVRLRPPAPGLLEPYDLQRQFDILRALEPTAVRVPRALWIEPTGDVLGRPFYVMDRVPGTVYERETPDQVQLDPATVRRMCEGLVDQFAAIHLVDLDGTGLRRLSDGTTFLGRELERWAGEIRRVQTGPLPALERLHAELLRQQPPPTDRVTLVHGDAKPGNTAFVGYSVSAVFDWELADVGDPMADIGYLEHMWRLPVGLPSFPGAITADELVARWEHATGLAAHDREWYRAFQLYKVLAIMLVGSMLFERAVTDDLRLAQMGYGVAMLTPVALADLGVDEPIEIGPVTPSDQRMAAARRALKRTREPSRHRRG